ncbi:hypothetical protein M427DRAFT_34428 [Gonapodya prolifera JEL478]|uniref:Uncharacterized protein n=1 Tax=Gonapodya prolifera (strain JEL478) TaxID=1344416 RepID=A0A139A887_GONPJ|nr:hypothetical protein M427DRAFT_34428 [Gonapodya prolifera JEL478]|eukprot:KXS13012.1 hypothetical protein M427DRAFT_34428 [Gonapodya prolifera JEL478]
MADPAQILYAALVGTLSADENVRKASEEQLKLMQIFLMKMISKILNVYAAFLNERAMKGLRKLDDNEDQVEEELEDDIYLEMPLDKIDLKSKFKHILDGMCNSHRAPDWLDN